MGDEADALYLDGIQQMVDEEMRMQEILDGNERSYYDKDHEENTMLSALMGFYKGNHKGKYVIVASSKYNSAQSLYMQDRKKSKARWWTNSFDSAIKFTSLEEAEKTLIKLKYGKPVICQL